jgi:uncharacterized protein
MDIEFDPNKSAKNEKERGLPFSLASNFVLETAYIVRDLRHSTEERFKATGYIDAKLYTIIFTIRNNKFRVISLRDASRAERNDYATQSSTYR